MKKIKGTGISQGCAVAKLKIISEKKAEEERQSQGSEKEWEVFLNARSEAIKQLNALAEKAKKEMGDDLSVLFETHAMMAEDPDFEDGVADRIKNENMEASKAVKGASEDLCVILESMDDEYMKARGADIRDVAKRIINIIVGDSDNSLSFDEPTVIAVDDLSPSETLRLNKDFVKGFILYKGTANGHTGILARNMGIPAIIRPEEELNYDLDEKTVFIDGLKGLIIAEPEGDTLSECIKAEEEYKKTREGLERYKFSDTVTKDGRRIKLYCNIGNSDDAKLAAENGAEGIGLFRSEFLYFKGTDYPTEEEQFEAYKTTLETMNGKEVIIRTCDIGSDKKIDYFELPDEQNPALGTRAIRICLDRKEMFKAQLRALYRASVYGSLSVMFPMIASLWEIQEAKEIIKEVKAELKAEGKAFSDNVRVGIMIETPAAAVISDKLAKEADFFSIGSNDLTQYTLACDRNSDLGRFFDPHHPAVLRLIETVAKNAHNAGIEVGICGELGADEELSEFFLNIGIDELSVSPSKITALRKRICEM